MKATAGRDLLGSRVTRLASMDALDDLVSAYADAASLMPSSWKPILRGEPLGYPVHPMLTDLPIGFWTSASVLDLVGGHRGADMARRLLGLGVLSAIPAELSGLAEFETIDEQGERRVAAIHGVSATVSVLLFALSWRLRRRHRLLGIAVTWAASVVITLSGVLGGQLAFGQMDEAIAVAGEPRPSSQSASTDHDEVIG